jgi:hypothetical protein
VIWLALAGTWLLPCAARADPVPTPQAPVVVAGAPVTLAEAQARAGAETDPDLVETQVDALVRARWVAGEAALRGVHANPARVAGVLAREQRTSGPADATRRAEVEEQVLREALVDSITAQAHGDARPWGAALDDFNRRWRAVTVCAPGLSGGLRDDCGNYTPRKHGCSWFGIGTSGFFGLGDLCDLGKQWAVDVDLVTEFYPRSDPSDLACLPQGDAALARLRRYLKRTAPRVQHLTFFDGDCDPQLMAFPYRSAGVTVLHAVARIAAAERLKRRST